MSQDRIEPARQLPPERANLMLRAAEMYFLHDESRSAIGEKLGISRFKVARLLQEARETGVVNITLSRPDGIDPQRADALCSRWCLGRCIVVPGQPDDRLLQVLAEAAASYLIEHTLESDILGVASGRTTSRVSRLIRSLPRCTVVQIAGVASSTSLWDNPTETVRRMAQITSGPSWPIFAPIVLSSREAAETLRKEPGIAAAHALFPQLTRVLMTTAPWQPGESMIHDSIPAGDQSMVAACNPAADLLANVIDAEGRQVAHDFTARALSVTMDQLRAVPDVIVVAGGQRRHAAVLACLKSGVANTLITDSGTADYLLSHS